MSQDDILKSTKSVIQGLDALKNEHGKMLENIVDSMNISSQTDTNKLEEKVGLLRKSMDMIELGKFNLFNKRNSNNHYFIFLRYR
jgi:polyhydroxyalkanoate synthesis regulator phasin